jgi:hypothetical protein
MNAILIAKITAILFASLFLVVLALKKPSLKDFFERASLVGIFLFALFIPIKDGFAIFGMIFAIIFFIAFRISKRDFKLPYTVFNKPIIIYILIVVLSFLWTYSFSDSINEGGEILYFFAFFFVVAELLNTYKRIMFIVYTFAFSITIAIFYGFFQGIFINSLHSASRVTGLIGNWDGYPVQISYGIVLFLSLYMLKFNGTKINKINKINKIGELGKLVQLDELELHNLNNQINQVNREGASGIYDGFPLNNQINQVDKSDKNKYAEYKLTLSGIIFHIKELYAKIVNNKVIRNSLISIIIFTGLISIILSKARSAWIGVFLGIFIIMFLKSKKVFVTALIIIFIFNAGFLYASKSFRSRIFAMFNPQIYLCEVKGHGDIESHIALVESAAAVFFKHPLTGVGVGAFSKYFNTHKNVHFPYYYNPKTGEKKYDTYDNWPENGYMQTLAETGIFSFIVLMWLFFLGLKEPIELYINSKDVFVKKMSIMTAGMSMVFYGSFIGISNMSNDQLTDLWLLFLAIFASVSNMSKNSGKDY